ncbi:MAG: 30S ribosomal protein S12 methylthiotransferase RimO [Alistipes sp.]|nr:30S ribosomal protein S12 methylthiotransferase RimO [Alistipes sp.]
MKTINVITLGCSKNTVDSEHLMAQLEAAGYQLSADEERLNADVVVINTCGFIGDAKQESIELILEAVAAKEAGLIEQLFVIGCLSERYADELRNEIPEVDKYFGVKDWAAIVEALGGEHKAELETERWITTPSHYAYLKIAEGCNWLCGYCAIPLIRGKHTSIPMEQIEEEARKLAARGVKELMVIAQDTTYYGIDLYGERRLAELLERLCRIEGIEWIRLHYAYPAAFPEDVIEVMAREPKICKYLDIPFQHISDNMLSAMKRRHNKAEALELIKRLRRLIPDIALRTTLLVGYPGETEQDIKELEEFVREVKFDRLGVFPYSEEEGTYSATHLKDDVPDEVKQYRADYIMKIQEQIALDNNYERVGRTMKVIVDSRQGDYYIARSEYDSPEVDQEILIPAHLRQLRRGCFYEARITGAENFDLYAEVIAPYRKKGGK